MVFVKPDENLAIFHLACQNHSQYKLKLTCTHFVPQLFLDFSFFFNYSRGERKSRGRVEEESRKERGKEMYKNFNNVFWILWILQHHYLFALSVSHALFNFHFLTVSTVSKLGVYFPFMPHSLVLRITCIKVIALCQIMATNCSINIITNSITKEK
ncbi:hypothetical protein BpHYR1_039090 [Brachionus plicatilis]|uniref:Uncharacterized protein n=1 Tax=Brachionus plicatilis TaxID=10195 RepID=A0A3M7RZJ6_BRAPC|nr:hypothetical protein BpHYR1_039090 [Brachionus plicatilis]